MPKAREVYRALLRDGWRLVRRSGSHRTLRKGDRTISWAHHDGKDLGNRDVAQFAGDCG